MTRSRGQFDTRHGDGEAGEHASRASGRVPAWLSFHRVETALVAWVLVGVGLAAVLLGGSLLAPPESGAASALQTAFWTTLLLAVPLLGASLLVHAAVDVYRLVAADGEIASWWRAGLRGLQTASSLVFALGVVVIAQDTTPADAEFNPAALVSAFLLVAGLTGMVAFVALDGLVRLVRGTW